VNVKMFEGSGKMGFEPTRVEVRKGEQVRFVYKTRARRITSLSSRRSWTIASMQKS
jgi:hypothetical protein